MTTQGTKTALQDVEQKLRTEWRSANRSWWKGLALRVAFVLGGAALVGALTYAVLPEDMIWLPATFLYALVSAYRYLNLELFDVADTNASDGLLSLIAHCQWESSEAAAKLAGTLRLDGAITLGEVEELINEELRLRRVQDSLKQPGAAALSELYAAASSSRAALDSQATPSSAIAGPTA